MKYIKFNKKRIGFKTRGRGKRAIVFLHGFCEDSCLWDDFKQDLLQDKYKVIAIDLPGFGKSEVVEGVTIAYMAEAVFAVFKHLKLEKIILIGHSMGGYVTLAFGERYPEFLEGIGLFHSHGYADGEETKKNRQKAIDFVKRQGHALYVKQIIPTFFSEAYAQSNPYQLDKLIHKASGYQAEGIMEAQKAMMKRPDRTAVLENAKIPVLFIFGEHDTFITPEKAMQQVKLPRVSFAHLLPNVGHMGMFEATHKTQFLVKQFVEYCESENEKT